MKNNIKNLQMKNDVKNLQLKDFVHINKGLIPKDTCRFVIDSIKNKSWGTHLWSEMSLC